MSRKRVLGVSALVVLGGLVVLAAVLLWSLMDLGQKLNRLVDEGLIGPEDQRQRVETTHGFAISIAGDWTAEDPPPDPDAGERLGLRVLLTMHPPEEEALCWVSLAAGTAPHWVDPDGSWPDGDASLGEQLLGPWLAERGIHAKGWGATSGGLWREHMAGLTFGEDAYHHGAAWVIPRTDDLYVLACTWTEDADVESGPGWWINPSQASIAMSPMAGSLEFLPEEE